MSALDPIHLDRIVADLSSLAAILYTSLMYRSYRKETIRTAERERQYNDVLKGVSAGPGIEARPSLVERLGGIEKQFVASNAAQTRLLDEILSQIKPVGGPSLLERIEKVNALVIDHLAFHAKNISPRRTNVDKDNSQSS